MPLRVLLSAVGFTFSLVFATQGCVQTFSDARRAVVSLRRCLQLAVPQLHPQIEPLTFLSCNTACNHPQMQLWETALLFRKALGV